MSVSAKLLSTLQRGLILGVQATARPPTSTVSSLTSTNPYLQALRRYSAAAYTTRYADYETIQVLAPFDHVLHVQLHRPESDNTFDREMFRELMAVFREIQDDKQCRVVVLSGSGKLFSAGRDEEDRKQIVAGHEADPDVARKAKFLRSKIGMFQDAFNTVEKCQKPVIAAIHGACKGIGVDLVCAADIRYCTKDAYFQIQEVQEAVTPFMGSLQRIPKMVANDSLIRELVFTGRKLTAQEAKEVGLVSRLFDDQKQLIDSSIQLATDIAKNSPVAVQGAKLTLTYSRDHSVKEGLQFVAMLSSSNLQSDDFHHAHEESPKFTDL